MNIKLSPEDQERLRVVAQEELERLQRGEPTPLVSIEPAERLPLDEEAAKQLISMTFVSRTGGIRPHIVVAHFGNELTCSCQSTSPCWAIAAYKRVAGIQ